MTPHVMNGTVGTLAGQPWRYLMITFLTGVPSLSFADRWDCHVDVEVQCSDELCNAYPGDIVSKPPVGATFDTEGNFSICAYAGCYVGKGLATRQGPFLSIAHESATWTDSDIPKPVFIVLDTTDNFGLFKAATFVQPMICKKLK